MTSLAERLRGVRGLCVGLDPYPPYHDSIRRILSAIDSTRDLVHAYKLNLTLYECMGAVGYATLHGTIARIREHKKDTLIIGDGKRGDILPVMEQYARFVFDELSLDAVTSCARLHVSLLPLLDKGGVFVLDPVILDHPNLGYVLPVPETLSTYGLPPAAPLLIPGVGAQGGTVPSQSQVSAPCLISSSRAIIYSDDPRAAALELKRQIDGNAPQH